MGESIEISKCRRLLLFSAVSSALDIRRTILIQWCTAIFGQIVPWWNLTGIKGEFLFRESRGVLTVWQPGSGTSTSNSVLTPEASLPSKFPSSECAEISSLEVGCLATSGLASRGNGPGLKGPGLGREPATAIPPLPEVDADDMKLGSRPMTPRGDESPDFWACFSKRSSFRIGSNRWTFLLRQLYSTFSLRNTFIRWRRTLARGVNLKAIGIVPLRGKAFPEINIS
jgi:hypothetical protein